MHVLIVEDDLAFARMVERLVQAEGDTAEVVHSGEAALAAMRRTRYDMVLLDWELPGRNGLSVVRTLRAEGYTTPVLIVTSHVDERKVVAALEAGADDYLVKPLSPVVLQARRRAVIGRAEGPAPSPASAAFRVGTLTLDPTTRRVFGPGGTAPLTAKESALLSCLMREPGSVVPRHRLLEQVWGYAFDPGTSVLEVTLSRLRRTLEPVASGVTIRTVRGLGVVLEDAPAAPRE